MIELVECLRRRADDDDAASEDIAESIYSSGCAAGCIEMHGMLLKANADRRQAAAEIERLCTRIAELETERQWSPIKDVSHEELVLLAYANGMRVGYAIHGEKLPQLPEHL